MKVMIAVTHLLGSGHLSRALTLGRAFAASGHDVRVTSGGMPAPQLASQDVTLVQLPPLRSDGVNFTRLLDEQGHVATPELRASRIAQLIETLRNDPPDVVITELFPFGRRNLRDEFGALLQATQKLPQKPLVLSSIRDILAPPSKPQKATFADEMIAKHYDAVLVHSDKAITPLSASWPVSNMLNASLHYTGFVAPAPPVPDGSDEGHDEIIVSAGGGGVGQALFSVAMDAARDTPAQNWRILVGGPDAAAKAQQLQNIAPQNVTIEPARADFRQLLLRAKASVSMCGYNTALDVLQTGVPAVFVPFDDGGEVEQTLRATTLAKQPGIAVVTSAEATHHALLKAVALVCAAPQRHVPKDGFEGAQNTVSIVESMVAQR